MRCSETGARMYYKVVRSFCLQSAIVRGAASVQYSIGTWVRAPSELEARGFGLMVFDNLKDATSFMQDRYDLKIYRCKCEGKMKMPLLEMYYPIDDYMPELLGSMGKHQFYAPSGSHMFKKVKLTVPVKDAEIEEVLRKLYG